MTLRIDHLSKGYADSLALPQGLMENVTQRGGGRGEERRGESLMVS
jgi:hypothetical protein